MPVLNLLLNVSLYIYILLILFFWRTSYTWKWYRTSLRSPVFSGQSEEECQKVLGDKNKTTCGLERALRQGGITDTTFPLQQSDVFTSEPGITHTCSQSCNMSWLTSPSKPFQESSHPGIPHPKCIPSVPLPGISLLEYPRHHSPSPAASSYPSGKYISPLAPLVKDKLGIQDVRTLTL